MLVRFRSKERGKRTFDVPPKSVDALEWGFTEARKPDVDPDLKNLVDAYVAALHREQDRKDEDNTRGWYG